MRTDDLIRHLAADAPPRRRNSIETRLAVASGIGLASVLALVLAMLGIRPDLADSLITPAGALKVTVSIAVIAAGFHAACLLARPGTPAIRALSPVVLVLLAAGSIAALPGSAPAIGPRLFGVSECAATIFVLGMVPLAVSLAALRIGAPTRPCAAGAAAGLLAGGVAAAGFTMYCPMDDPALVTIAYSVAIALVGALGGAFGARFLRW